MESLDLTNTLGGPAKVKSSPTIYWELLTAVKFSLFLHSENFAAAKISFT